jgi:hypothetical protein
LWVGVAGSLVLYRRLRRVRRIVPTIDTTVRKHALAIV